MKLLRSLAVIALICYGQSVLAMNQSQQPHHVANQSPKIYISDALITQSKIPNVHEMNNKLIDLLINEEKYDTTLGREITNKAAYAEKLMSQIELIAQDKKKSLKMYILMYLLYQATPEVDTMLDSKIQALLHYRQHWFSSAKLEQPPKDLQTLQALISKNIDQLELDGEIGYHFEFNQNDKPPYFLNNILKNGITIGEYFGNQYAEYYLQKREELLASKGRLKRTQNINEPIAALKDLDAAINVITAMGFINQDKIYQLFGLPDNYTKADVEKHREALKTRYKRLARLFHPDKHQNEQQKSQVAEVMKAINNFYNTL